MAILVESCPRCDTSKITFDVKSTAFTGFTPSDWQHNFEAFCVCRHCQRATIFLLRQNHIKWREVANHDQPEKTPASLTDFFVVRGFINVADRARTKAPEYTDDAVAKAFNEASACMTVQAWNGAGAMLRLAIDLATKQLLPTEFTVGLNRRARRDLAPRLEWLFANGKLPKELNELSACIREDGNDGAHDGSLGKEDAEDLMDFATAMFERMYTEPHRLRLAVERRNKRRGRE